MTPDHEEELVRLRDENRLLRESRDYWMEQYQTTSAFTRQKIKLAIADCIVKMLESDPLCLDALRRLEERVVECIKNTSVQEVSLPPTPIFAGCNGTEVPPSVATT